MTRRFLLALPLVAMLLAAPAARAVLPPDRPGGSLPDVDVRGERAGVAAPKTPEQVIALERLRAESASEPGGPIVFVAGPDAGTLHHVFRRGGFLTPPRAGSGEEIARAFVARHRDLFGLSVDGVRNLQVVHDVVDPETGARHVYFEQSLDGLPIFHGEVRIHMDRHGRVLSAGGNGAREAVRSDAATLDAREGLRAAAAFAGMQVAPEDVPEGKSVDPTGLVRFARGPFAGEPWARQAWFPMDGGLVRSWMVTLDPPRDVGWYQVVVDAATGEPLHRVDLVDHAATEGLVFREDPGQGPQLVLPFVDDAVNTDAASPAGWSAAGLTQGNNADCKDDIANDDEGTDGRRAPAALGPPIAFSFPFQDNPALDLDASVTNLFYLNNWLHDRLVRLGFDEASANFQLVNFSGQGRGGDAVYVDAQDGSGTNNANFGTPPDGFPPRMQMYVWTFTNPARDSGFDGSVVTHELFHGVSNRLVGLASSGAGCLGGPQGGAMGEAWSDFYPCSFWNTPTVGGYVVNDYVRGIRRAPYDNYPFGYGQLCNQGGFEVHRDGEIWAAILWDLRELFIQKYGYQRGKCLVERLVLDGMKLSPCLPTYVDMRDAILLAAQLRGNDGDTCLLWQGFAARGLGTGAVSKPDCTSAADASNVVPPECAACTAFAPPSSVVVDASQPNQIAVDFVPAPGADAHVLLVAPGSCPMECAEAPFEEAARGAGDATRLVVVDRPEAPLSVGTRLAVRVVALQGACTAGTSCEEVTITGRCTLPPTALSADAGIGVAALIRPPQAACAMQVAWHEARAACGGSASLRYNVYRSDDPAFVPGPENLVASVPAPATTWTDDAVPASAVTYVVRAEDLTTGGLGPHGGNEEPNLARLTLAPQGAVSGTTAFADDGESGERPGYRRTGSFPINDWAIVSDANTRGGSAWHSTDVEGGNADKNLHVPPLSLGAAPRLRFNHAFWMEDAFDGGVIEISTDNGRTWRDLVDDIVAGGYATSAGAGFSFTVGDMIHPPNDNRLWTGQNASGFPNYDAVDVDLTPYAGTLDAQLRFRTLIDPLAAEPGGWYVDDIVVDDVLSFDACTTTCLQPPVVALADAVACTSSAAPVAIALEASASTPGGAPLASDLGLVLTHDGPGAFGGRRWQEGPRATLEFPPGTPAGDYPVRVTARDEAGCVATAVATVSLRDETFAPPPLGSVLRVWKETPGLRLEWADAGAPSYNVHRLRLGDDLRTLAFVPPWVAAVAPPARLATGEALAGGGTLFLSVHSATDCGRSVP